MAATITTEISLTASSEHAQIVALTLKAIQLAKSAVAHALDGLGQRSSAPFEAVNKCEQELDRLDREVDERVAHLIIRVSAPEARELLACMKFVIDLERIGDLLCSLTSRAQAIGSRVNMEDISDLMHMATALEQMLVDIYEAFSGRRLDNVISVFRGDAVIDRYRNLLFMRHVENREEIAGPEGIHVLFMAQALERAGDHVKNLAEEVCHLVSGHSVRHLRQINGRSEEQMFIDWLRTQHGSVSNLPED